MILQTIRNANLTIAPAIAVTLVLCALTSVAIPFPQSDLVSVKGKVQITKQTASSGGNFDSSNAVVWLKSATAETPAAPPSGARAHFKIVQQNKRFNPHILAVPVGSTVDFPNLDPFFHNVFSMFDGKRFDLGLYEAGGSHPVKFDAPGICYVFCNIHPDMSSAIVVVDTPYYATTSASGDYSIPNMPAGVYQVSVWHERGKPNPSAPFPRQVTISAANFQIPVISLIEGGSLLMPHKNKYGGEYDPAVSSPPYK